MIRWCFDGVRLQGWVARCIARNAKKTMSTTTQYLRHLQTLRCRMSFMNVWSVELLCDCFESAFHLVYQVSIGDNSRCALQSHTFASWIALCDTGCAFASSLMGVETVVRIKTSQPLWSSPNQRWYRVMALALARHLAKSSGSSLKTGLITWGCKTTLCSVWSDVLVLRCCWISERIFVLLSLLCFTVQAYLIVVHWQATCYLHMQHQSTCCRHILVCCIVASQPFNIIMNYVSIHLWRDSSMYVFMYEDSVRGLYP